MNRTALVLSTLLIVAGAVLMVYADPLARLSLSTSSARPTFSFTGALTTTIGSRTVTIGPGGGGFGNFTSFNFTRTGGLSGLPGAVVTSGANATNEQVESLIAIMLIGVGLVFEVLTIFLWEGQSKPVASPPATE